MARTRLSSFSWQKFCLASSVAGLIIVNLVAPAYSQSQRLPSLGEGVSVSLTQENKWGQDALSALWRSGAVIDDPLLTDYLLLHWLPLQRAATALGWLNNGTGDLYEWRLLPIRDSQINAFALPGGVVGVHTGLISATPNAESVSAVLAHELSHVALRHIARMIDAQNRNAPWVLGAILLGVAAAGSSPDLANAAIVGGQAAAIQSGINFTRDMEVEADRVGLVIYQTAGLPAGGFVDMFEVLQQASRLNDDGSFGYLRTHPLTPDRITQARLRANSLSQVDVPPEHKQAQLMHPWVQMRTQVMSSERTDDWRAWWQQAQGPVQPLLLYRGALAAIELKEYASAEDLLLRAHGMLGNDVLGQNVVQQALMQMWAKQPQPSSTMNAPASQQWVKHGLQATDRSTLLAASALGLRLGWTQDIASRLQWWVSEHPNDVLAWRLLGQARQAQGRPIAALGALAEAQWAMNDLAGARDRLQAALDASRNGRASVEDAQAISARLRWMKEQISNSTAGNR